MNAGPSREAIGDFVASEYEGTAKKQVASTDRCPTCGSAVKVHTSDEGTSHYVPLPQRDETVTALRRLASADLHDGNEGYCMVCGDLRGHEPGCAWVDALRLLKDVDDG